MNETHVNAASDRGGGQTRGRIRGPNSLVGGLCVIALGAFALWAMSGLAQGTLRSMGPGMLPRSLAVLIVACGAALLLIGLVKRGDALEGWSFRGPLFVVLGILAFAVTIRPVTLGPITTPGLGLIVAGPLAIFIGGLATNEVRLRELTILALALTPACMVLFGDLLNLAIPMFPQGLADLFPAGWSQKQRLRVIAAILAGAALLIFLATRKARRSETRTVAVPDHSGSI